MESRIKVNFDHAMKEPYIAVYLEDLKPEDNDLRDEMLHLFMNQANSMPVAMVYPYEAKDNRTPQFRIITEKSPLDQKDHLLGVFGGFARSIINSALPNCEQNKVEKIYYDFFNLMHELAGIHREGVVGQG